MHLGTIVGLVLAVLLVASIILAGIYINGHPTSNAALFFIEVCVGWGDPSAIPICVSIPQPFSPYLSSFHPSPTSHQAPVPT